MPPELLDALVEEELLLELLDDEDDELEEDALVEEDEALVEELEDEALVEDDELDDEALVEDDELDEDEDAPLLLLEELGLPLVLEDVASPEVEDELPVVSLVDGPAPCPSPPTLPPPKPPMPMSPP